MPEGENLGLGQPNSYGHPNAEALSWIGATGAQIWRTDERGTLTLTWDASGHPVVSGER